MANLTDQELRDRLADILLSNVRDNTLFLAEDGQFDPNHIDSPFIPRSMDRMLSTGFLKENIIQALNELLDRVINSEGSLENSLSQQFSVIGNFVSFPDKKTNMEKIAPDILEALVAVYRDIHGPDLDNPVNLASQVLDGINFSLPLSRFSIESGGETIETISIVAASTETGGYLTSGDWDTFNSKENALTFDGPLSRTENTISIVEASAGATGALSSTDWDTFNSKENALTFDGPLSRTENTISIIEASAGATGALSSTDWRTFNSKENALIFNGPLSRVADTISIPKASATTDGYLSKGDWSTFNSKADGGSTVTVTDNLDSTSSTEALSANQGNVIKKALFEVSGRVFHVDVNRVDTYTANGSEGWPYQSLSALVAGVVFQPNDTILLSSGTYTVSHNTTLSLLEGMTLSGVGFSTVIQAELNNSAASTTNVITVASDAKRVLIKDLTLSGNNDYTQVAGDPSRQVKGVDDNAQNLIFIGSSSEVRVTGCYLEQSTLDAIRIVDSADCIVTENILKNNGRQAIIEVGTSAGNIIDNNINSGNGQQEA